MFLYVYYMFPLVAIIEAYQNIIEASGSDPHVTKIQEMTAQHVTESAQNVFNIPTSAIQKYVNIRKIYHKYPCQFLYHDDDVQLINECIVSNHSVINTTASLLQMHKQVKTSQGEYSLNAFLTALIKLRDERLAIIELYNEVESDFMNISTKDNGTIIDLNELYQQLDTVKKAYDYSQVDRYVLGLSENIYELASVYPCEVLHSGYIYLFNYNTQNNNTLSLFNTYAILHTCISIVSIIGNSLVIASVISAKCRTNQMLVKTSLAFADLVSMIGMVILSGLELAQLNDPYIRITVKGGKNNVDYCTKKYINEVFNYTFDFVFNVSTSISYYNIALMALLKLYALACPFRHRSLSKAKVFLFIVAVWLVPIATLVGLQWYLNAVTYSPWAIQLYHIMVGLVPYTITILSVILLCIYFFKYKRRQSRIGRQRGTPVNQRQQEMLSSETVRFIKKILYIILGYTITIAPYGMWVNVKPHDIPTRYARVGVLELYSININDRFYYTILYLNTIVDVIVYSCLDPEFQQYIRSSFNQIFRDRSA